VDRWITANVSSCIDFYGIDKLINTEVAITIAAIGIIGLLMRNSLLNKIASYTKRKYATINGFKQQEN
jgi:plastocyanin domain-containing protein